MHGLAQCRVSTRSWRMPLVLVLSLLGQGLSGCGSSLAADESLPLTASAQSLTGPTCVTLQRGGTGTVADAHISSHQPSHSAGSEPVAQVGEVGRHTRQLLLHFDTSSIPPHATLTSATLSLWRQGPFHPATLTAHAITTPWQEQSVSWRGFSSAFTPQVAASVLASGKPGPVSISLTELVSVWVRHPVLNQGLLLQQSQGHSLLATSESPNVSHRPGLQVCFFLPDASPANSSAPSLLLRVLDDSGQPLSGAAVSSTSAQLPTDGAGYVVLDNLPSGSFSAHVEAIGFAPAVVSFHLPPGARASHEVRLLPLGQPRPFSVSAGATLEHGSLRVSIPPHSVVDTDGNPVSGTVQATLVPLDPTTVPTSALPGPLEGLASEGTSEPVPLESFGMAEVSLWQDGRPLQLAPGAKATLELLLPASASSQLSPGDAIPAWWLDTARGLWVREGTGTVQHSSTHPGRLSWVVEVGHFTWWNCDAPLSDRSCVDVLVSYSNGLPAPGAQVGATGVSYTGSSRTVYTGSDGRACVEIKRGGTARVFAGVSGQPLGEATVTGSTEPTACGGGACTALSFTVTPPVCIPGSTQTCSYSGPVGTENVGLCRAAHRYCNITGTAWGACEGEVLPATETCSNTFDEDCDGATNEGCRCGSSCYSGPPGTSGIGICRAGAILCPFGVPPYCAGQKLPSTETCATPEDDNCDGSLTCTNPLTQAWRYGNASCQYASQLIMSSDGNPIVSGQFLGSLDLGNGIVLTGSSAAYTAFFAKFDASTGGALWATKLEPTQWIHVRYNQKDASGNLIVSGEFSGNLKVGGSTLSNPDGSDGFVMKLDGASGSILWFAHLNSTSTTYLYMPVVDTSGNLIVSGNFYGNLTVSGTTLSNPSGNDGFVMKLEGTSGAILWRSHLSSTSSSSPSTPVVDTSGNLIVSGNFHGNLTVSGTTLSNPGGYDVFVMKLEGGSGRVLWLAHFDGTSSNYASTPVVDTSGDLIVSGNFHGNLTVGSTTLSNPGGSDVFVMKLEGASGIVLWSAHFDSTRFSYASTPVVDTSGNLMVSGYFSGNLTVGGTTLSNPGGSDGFVVKLEGASGSVLWSAHFDSTGSSYAYTPVVDASGNLISSGEFNGSLTVGGITLSNPGSSDGFMMKMEGVSGAILWLVQFDSTNYTYASIPVVNASGNLIVSGYFDGNLTVGGTTLSNPAGRDVFVANFEASSGALSWVRHFDGTSGVSLGQPLAVTPESIFVTGSFDGSLNMGGPTPLTSAGCYDIYLAKLSSKP